MEGRFLQILRHPFVTETSIDRMIRAMKAHISSTQTPKMHLTWWMERFKPFLIEAKSTQDATERSALTYMPLMSMGTEASQLDLEMFKNLKTVNHWVERVEQKMTLRSKLTMISWHKNLRNERKEVVNPWILYP